MSYPQLRIFISYRRDDTAGHALHLYDLLSGHFGREQVFMDVDTIKPGVDFVEEIRSAVSACHVLIALIGRQWLSVTNDSRQRRLDDPEDFVRLEIETALERNIRAIPVLLDGATMPLGQELPDALRPLVRRNALEISNTHFKSDTDRLLRVLEEEASLLSAKQAEAERRAREKNEQERSAKERAEKERIAREKAERERLAREKAEADRLAKQQAEAERAAQEKTDREQRARDRAKAIATLRLQLRRVFTGDRIRVELIALLIFAALVVVVGVLITGKNNAAGVSATQTAAAIVAVSSPSPSDRDTSTHSAISPTIQVTIYTQSVTPAKSQATAPPLIPTAKWTSTSSLISKATPSPSSTRVISSVISTTSPPGTTPSPTVIPTIAANLWWLHQVCSGQTLSTIAENYGTTSDILAAVNQIPDPGMIAAGQMLIIPRSSEPLVLPKFISYRVAPNDTLSLIAEQYSTSVAVMQAINNLNDPDQIYPGSELTIPLGLTMVDKINRCSTIISGTLRLPAGLNAYLRAKPELNSRLTEFVVANGTELYILGRGLGIDGQSWYKVNSITTNGIYSTGWLLSSWISLPRNVSASSIPFVE